MDTRIAALLQASSACMFFIAGAIGPGAGTLLFAPAVASGVAGWMLWGRAAKGEAVGRTQPPALEAQSSRVEEILVGLQEDVAQLREDREFYRALYDPNAAERSLLTRSHPESR